MLSGQLHKHTARPRPASRRTPRRLGMDKDSNFCIIDCGNAQHHHTQKLFQSSNLFEKVSSMFTPPKHLDSHRWAGPRRSPIFLSQRPRRTPPGPPDVAQGIEFHEVKSCFVLPRFQPPFSRTAKRKSRGSALFTCYTLEDQHGPSKPLVGRGKNYLATSEVFSNYSIRGSSQLDRVEDRKTQSEGILLSSRTDPKKCS